MQRRGDRCVVRIPILLHPIPSLFREEELCRAALGLLARKGEKRFKRAVHVAFFTYKHEARADICRFARKRIVRVQLLVRSLDERFRAIFSSPLPPAAFSRRTNSERYSSRGMEQRISSARS